MSHFVVLILGEDPESQLEPFSEHLEVDRYLVGEVSAEELESFISYCHKEWKEQNPSKPFPESTLDELYKAHGNSWNGNRWEKGEDGVWRDYSTYNPDSKWDWYKLGGRWTGYFKLKKDGVGIKGEPGLMTQPAEAGTVDQALKSEIDFEAMEKDAADQAAKDYDEARKILDEVPAGKSWAQVREENKELPIEQVRNIYHMQPMCTAWKKAGRDMFDRSPEDFLIPREEFIQAAKDRCWIPYAVLHNREWLEKGQMGWFGIGHNELDQDEWNKRVAELIRSLPEDTLLSVYDCHI